jgi:small subunit ribosomal protein S6
MTATAPIYDLMLLLDLDAEETARARALSDTRASIEAHGELVRDDDWGERPLAYPIERRKSAEYHLLQFHTEDRDLLSGLERTLHITDGVLRFRLIKLRPGVPAPPDMRAGAPPRRAEHEQRGEGERPPRRRVEEGEAAAEQAPAPAEASAVEASAAEAPAVEAPATSDVETSAAEASPAAEPAPEANAPEAEVAQVAEASAPEAPDASVAESTEAE